VRTLHFLHAGLAFDGHVSKAEVLHLEVAFTSAERQDILLKQRMINS
jgi:hypothetical protein